MSTKLQKLPREGRSACIALAASTQWSAEEWARSIWTLDDAGLFPLIGLTQVYELSTKTGLPPADVAQVLVKAALEETMKAAQEHLDLLAPTKAQLDAGVDLTPFLNAGEGMRVVFVDDHEKTTICGAISRDYPSAPHFHACRRLERHTEHETGREHSCTCGAIW